jgi:hypothetical protein
MVEAIPEGPAVEKFLVKTKNLLSEDDSVSFSQVKSPQMSDSQSPRGGQGAGVSPKACLLKACSPACGIVGGGGTFQRRGLVEGFRTLRACPQWGFLFHILDIS